MTKINGHAVLNSYLVQHLQPLTEADPNILAKYVSALLKNNKPKKELQAFCIEKLVDFLGEAANNFVVNLFQALDDGTVSAMKDPDDNSVIGDLTAVRAAAAAFKVPLARDNMEPKTSSQLEASNTRFSDYEEEGTDDEDDDRNHKHRRRVQRSQSLDRDSDDGPLRKRNRWALDTRYDNSNPTQEAQRGSDFAEKDGLLSKWCFNRDNVSGALPRVFGDTSHRGVWRGGARSRIDGIRTRFEHQSGFFRGSMGRGRGATTPAWAAREPRAAILDVLDFSLSMLPPGPLKSIYPGRSSSSLGHAVQSSWAGGNRFAGLTNGTLDQGLPLNTGLQGSIGGPISAPLGVNMNVAMGLGRRLRCPDFEGRGYCLRGDLCPMEHGANRIVIEDVQSLQKFNLPLALPSGRGMALGSASNFGCPGIVPGEANMASLIDSGIGKAALVSNANAEPELYDPDQPLWNKEQSAALADGLRSFPSFHSGPENNALEREVSEGGKEDSPVREGHGNPLVTSVRPQGLMAGQSVWNRIVGVDQVDLRENNSNNFNDLPIGSSQQPKDFEMEAGRAHTFSERDEREFKATRSSNAWSDIHLAPRGELGLQSGGQNILIARSFRPLNERAHKTLFVGCIPNNPNTRELLLAHFRKFGGIVDIRLLPNGEKAFVQFARHEDAVAALASPEAVMGNRFIQLSWAKRDRVQVSSPKGNITHILDDELGGLQLCETCTTTEERQVGASASEGIASKNAPKSTLIVQSPLPVSQKKRGELEHMKEELRRKQEELAQKRDEFRRKLERISGQGKGKSSEGVPDQGSDPTEAASSVEVKEDQIEDREMPEKRVTAITKQTALGIEEGSSSADQAPLTPVKGTSKQSLVLMQGPSAKSFQPSPQSLRGHAPPWPSTGSTGSTLWTPSRYKIDNRTSVFQVLPPFPDTVLDVPMLREHFSFFGDVTNVEIDTSDAGKGAMKVTLATRSDAERAFLQGRWYQGTCLNFSWVNPSMASTSAALLLSGSIHGEDCDRDPNASIERGPEGTQSCQGQILGMMNGVQKGGELLLGNDSDILLDGVMDSKRTTSNIENRASMDG